MQRTLSRAPLGSIGKSLREVVVGVEARLQQLQPALRENEGTAVGSSRPSTHGHPSASSKSAANGSCARGGPTAAGHHAPEDGGGGGALSWDTLNKPSEGSNSARDGYGGRPTTRDGRPTCDNARNGDGAGIRPGTEGGRPATSDCGLGRGTAGTALASGLDGTRPSTRDDMRLQQQLDGIIRPSARERKNGSREVTREHIETPRGGTGQNRLASRESQRGNRQSSCEGQRPSTRDGRDGVRPPRTGGGTERRCNDVTIRQVTGSRKKQSQKASDVLNLETVDHGFGDPLCHSPVSSNGDAFGDESCELLE